MEVVICLPSCLLSAPCVAVSASMSPWSSSLGLYSWMELSMANDICFEPVEPPNKVVVSPRVSKFDKIWWIWPGLNLKFRLVSIKLV
jgi:hypothetical protein